MDLIGIVMARRMWDDGRRVPAIKYLRHVNRDLDIHAARMELDSGYRVEYARHEKGERAIELHDALVAMVERYYDANLRALSFQETEILQDDARALLKRCEEVKDD